MNAPQEPWFDHEKLEVYREAVSRVAMSSVSETRQSKIDGALGG